MNKLPQIVLMITLGVLAGCYTKTKNDFLKQPMATVSTLPYTVGRVTVEDLRVNVSTTSLAIARMSRRGEQSMQPPLTVELENELIRTSQPYFRQGPTLDVEIKIHKAVQTLTTKLLSQKESSDCEVEVRLIDPATQKRKISARGSVQAEMQSLSASSDYSQKLFEKTLQDSLVKALSALK